MPANDLSLGTPVLEEAIDHHPLVVSPDALVAEAIVLMSQARRQSCSLVTENFASQEILSGEARSSCVLVQQDLELVGILTERDIVRLTAEGLNLAEMKIAEVMTHPVILLKEADFQDIFAALFLFRRYRIRHLPIVGKEGQLLGVVSPESIRQVLKPANLLKLRRVSEVMATEVIQASLDTCGISLARLMSENRVSCVVIVEERGSSLYSPVGIVTERDIVQFQALGVRLSEIKASEVMSTPLFLLKPSDSLWMAHQEMQRRHVRRLVVSWNWGQSLGIVTQTSLLRVFDPMEMYGVIDTLQRTVEQLEAKKSRELLS
jgi:CBS domain-containing protein